MNDGARWLWVTFEGSTRLTLRSPYIAHDMTWWDASEQQFERDLHEVGGRVATALLHPMAGSKGGR